MTTTVPFSIMQCRCNSTLVPVPTILTVLRACLELVRVHTYVRTFPSVRRLMHQGDALETGYPLVPGAMGIKYPTNVQVLGV